MINLNKENGADVVLLEVAQKIKDEKKKDIIGAEFGIAYGGGVEAIGKLWKDCGTIYGYDTFEDKFPTNLFSDSQQMSDIHMDRHYSLYGVEPLSYSYQRAALDTQGLTNVILRKGLVAPGCTKDIPYLNYALIDMDHPESNRIGYHEVKDKIVKGGYFCYHDYNHLGNEIFVENVLLKDPQWEVVHKYPAAYLLVLKKVK